MSNPMSPPNSRSTSLIHPPRPLSTRPSLTLLPLPIQPLAKPTFDSPDFRPVSMSRTVTHSGVGHTLMGATWNTPETIRELISFYRANAPAVHDDAEIRLEVRRFYVFGGGLNAHPGLLHGGVVGCILDSCLGGAVGLGVAQMGRAKTKGKDGEGEEVEEQPARLGVDGDEETPQEVREEEEGEGGEKGKQTVRTMDSMFTVQLNVRYRRPVSTPGAVMVRSWVTKVEEGGRKVWAAGVVEGPGGVVHAEAEGMWLRAKAKL